MHARKTFCSKQGESTVKPIEGIDSDACVIYPIISSGDVNGAVIMLADEKNSPDASEIDFKLAQTAAVFLSKQLES